MTVYYWYGTNANNNLDYYGSSTLWANAYDGNDFIWGNTGNDTIFGSQGDDTLKGYDGNDYLSGGFGNDWLYGENSNDELYGGDGSDRLYGGNGNDFLDGQVGNDFLYGDVGDDTLKGGSGNDYLTGGTGSDYISGGDGADTLIGYTATSYAFGQVDTLHGGIDTYTDYFYLGNSEGSFYLSAGHAVIFGFNRNYDWIISKGSKYDIQLTNSNSVGLSNEDTNVYWKGNLIAIIADTTNVHTAYDFIYV